MNRRRQLCSRCRRNRCAKCGRIKNATRRTDKLIEKLKDMGYDVVEGDMMQVEKFEDGNITPIAAFDWEKPVVGYMKTDDRQVKELFRKFELPVLEGVTPITAFDVATSYPVKHDDNEGTFTIEGLYPNIQIFVDDEGMLGVYYVGNAAPSTYDTDLPFSKGGVRELMDRLEGIVADIKEKGLDTGGPKWNNPSQSDDVIKEMLKWDLI